MAQRVHIPIIDPNPDCFQYYIVQYKSASDIGYNTAPNAYASPIIIDGLTEGVEYSFRITKVCCNGSVSDPTVFTYTPDPTPQFVNIHIINASGQAYSNFGVGLTLHDPEQPVYTYGSPFINLGIGDDFYMGQYPIVDGTTIPLTAALTTINNDPSNDMTVDLVIRDGTGVIIPDSIGSFSFGLVAAGGDNVADPLFLGTSPDDIWIIELTINP